MPVIRSVDDKPEWVQWSNFGVGIVHDAEPFDRHFHDAHEYWFIYGGRARVLSEGQEYVIGPGDILVTKMGDEHDILEILEAPLRSFWVEDRLQGQRRPGHLHRPEDQPSAPVDGGPNAEEDHPRPARGRPCITNDPHPFRRRRGEPLMTDETRTTSRSIAARSTITRRGLIAAAGSAALIAGAGAAGASGPKRSSRYQNVFFNRQEPVELTFQYWGSPQEQDAVKQMVDSFNEQNPGIAVRPQYVANDGYNERMTTALAGGQVPDIAYIDPGMAFDWARDGHTLDLTQYVTADADTATLLPNTNYTYDNGKILSTSLAITINALFYNRKLLSDAGVANPPTTGDTAWTWDQFIETAKTLTKDRNGKTAADPDFDPESIDVYGTTLPYWQPMLWSNNADYASQDGLTFGMNSPEALDVLQKLQDMIYVHHVSPTPATAQSLPATDVLMRTGKLAMDCNGAFKILDYANSEGLDWGVGVLPKIQSPITDRSGIPLIVSSKTPYPDQAYEFYRWRYSPERIDLYSRGLWMPVVASYYTDPAQIAQWLNPDVYPPESQAVLIDYALNNAPNQTPIYWLKNLNQLNVEVVTPAFDALFANEGDAATLFNTAAQQAAPLMQGRN